MRKKMIWTEKARGWILREQATGREYLWLAIAFIVVAAIVAAISWKVI